MLLYVNQSTIFDIKKAVRAALPDVSSSHASEAIAAGVGHNTSHALAAAMSQPSTRIRTLSDESFAARLRAITGAEVTGTPLLAAAVRSAPRALYGQDHEEGILAAVSKAIARARDQAIADDDTDVTAFSLNIEHNGGNQFFAHAAFRANYQMTIMIQHGSDDKAVTRLFDGDLATINEMLSGYDTDWIVNYVRSEDEALIRGEPTFDPKIVVDGVTVQVWQQAAVISHFESVGSIENREVIAIDKATFEKIGAALHDMGQWSGNPHAVQAIIDIVRNASPDLEFGAASKRPM